MARSIAQLQAATTELHAFAVPAAPFFDSSRGAVKLTSFQWRVLLNGFHQPKEVVPVAILMARVTGTPGQWPPVTKAALNGLLDMGYLVLCQEPNVGGRVVSCYKLAKPGDAKEVFLPAGSLAGSVEAKLMAIMQISPRSRNADTYARLIGCASASVTRIFPDLVRQGFVRAPFGDHARAADVPLLRLDLGQCTVIPHAPIVGMALMEHRGAQPRTPRVPRRQGAAAPAGEAPSSEGIDVTPILPSSAALLQQAMKETPVPKAEPTMAARNDAKAAFEKWREDYTWDALEEMPAADAGKAILWIHALLATSAASQPVNLAPQHLDMAAKVVEWARAHVANTSPDPADLMHIAVKKNAANGATRFVFESVLALFSSGYNGWTYAPGIIFDPGDEGGFQRHAMMALAMARGGGYKVRKFGGFPDDPEWVARGIDPKAALSYWPTKRPPVALPPRKLTFAESFQKMVYEAELAAKRAANEIEWRGKDRRNREYHAQCEAERIRRRVNRYTVSRQECLDAGNLDAAGRFEVKLATKLAELAEAQTKLDAIKAET